MIINTKLKEIKLDPIKSLISRADLKRTIRYTNHYFRKVIGCSQTTLIGMSDKKILHPDMPQVIYELMWDRIKNDEEMLCVIKYTTKNGDYYWATTLFKTKYHPISKEFNGYLALSHAVSKYAINHIEPYMKNC
ncbi:PAS domain-containing protein [Sulfurimonas sp.]|uniref:PAS domain-containing protein n=1 Tax=Sulfurimonas sp. TaxID=2022749 RepID=UPI002AB05BA6|nr:PAS domain-containing protein [Sulfurimonas sp.]